MAVTQAERDYVCLLQMRDTAFEIVTFSQGQTRASLDSDTMLLRALEMCIEIVGVTASRINQSFRDAHPEIAWSHFIDIGKHLIEEYNAVNLDRLWDTVQISIPALIVGLEKLLPSENTDET